jgi:hypothetical protein
MSVAEAKRSTRFMRSELMFSQRGYTCLEQSQGCYKSSLGFAPSADTQWLSEQDPRLNFQSLRYLFNVIDRDILLCTLNGTDISPVDASLKGEGLLTKSPFSTQ